LNASSLPEPRSVGLFCGGFISQDFADEEQFICPKLQPRSIGAREGKR
jgi:hypothetical protein